VHLVVANTGLPPERLRLRMWGFPHLTRFAIVAMLATLFVLINLVMDLVYTYLDPRIVFVRSKQ
jgi:hypothetical protein